MIIILHSCFVTTYLGRRRKVLTDRTDEYVIKNFGGGDCLYLAAVYETGISDIDLRKGATALRLLSCANMTMKTELFLDYYPGSDKGKYLLLLLLLLLLTTTNSPPQRRADEQCNS